MTCFYWFKTFVVVLSVCLDWFITDITRLYGRVGLMLDISNCSWDLELDLYSYSMLGYQTYSTLDTGGLTQTWTCFM